MFIPMKLSKIDLKLRSLESMGQLSEPEVFGKAENVEMTDEDAKIAENYEPMFSHNSLMEESNRQLDFINVFGNRVFVLVIGKI